MTDEGRQVEHGSDGDRRGRSPGGGSGDRVDLDVGGTVFATSISTLVSSSSYFERLFSHEWHKEHNGTPTVFLDQDPGPFKVLLSFMRLGCVRVEDLTSGVLLLAVFLDMQRLLSAVKCTTYRNTDPTFKGSDEEACASFDEEFGCILGALSDGVLPSRLTESLPQKEYGHILLKISTSMTARRDPVAFLDVPSCRSADLITTGSALTTPDTTEFTGKTRYTTFLDALNFLSRRGFTTLETEIQEEYNIDGGVDRRLTFSRFARGGKREGSLADIITQTPSKGGRKDGPKEFACIVDSKAPKEEDEYVCVYADIGSKETHETRHGDVVHAYCSRVPFDLRIAPGLDWLQKESYRQEEPVLGSILEKLWNEQYWWTYTHRGLAGNHRPMPENHSFVRLFSRKCLRYKDNSMRQPNSEST